MRLLLASNSLKTLDLFIKNAKHVPRELSVEYQKLVHRGHCAYHNRQSPWEPGGGGQGAGGVIAPSPSLLYVEI